jgi:hypothetical protein
MPITSAVVDCRRVEEHSYLQSAVADRDSSQQLVPTPDHAKVADR